MRDSRAVPSRSRSIPGTHIEAFPERVGVRSTHPPVTGDDGRSESVSRSAGNGNTSTEADLLLWLGRAAVRMAEAQDEHRAAEKAGSPLGPSTKKRGSAVSHAISIGRQLRDLGWSGRP